MGSSDTLRLRSRNYLLIFILLVTTSNIVLTRYHYEVQKKHPPSDLEYTYIGDDFPPSLPIRPLPHISTTIESSSRFRLSPHPSIASSFVFNVPSGIGFVRLGPNRRAFAISMYHELHCLLEIQQTIVLNPGGNGHVQHCLNYLRQGIMCSADMTLEPGDYRRWAQDQGGRTGSSGIVGDRVCRDWRVAHKFVEDNLAEWESWRKERVPHGTNGTTSAGTKELHIHG